MQHTTQRSSDEDNSAGGGNDDGGGSGEEIDTETVNSPFPGVGQDDSLSTAGTVVVHSPPQRRRYVPSSNFSAFSISALVSSEQHPIPPRV